MSLQFHVVAFEGPDGYARAGGLGSRVDGLSRALARLGFETHLWFVGDPDLPGHESRGLLHLHRWCQWLSRHHRGGVYDGEEPKRRDLTASLPPFLLEQTLLPHLRRGGQAAILAEEWHTAESALELDRLLRQAALRERVALLWNANHLFGFDRIPWQRLAEAAAITTVSRWMRFRIEPLGVRPLVLSNGLPPEAYETPDRTLAAGLRARLRGRLALAKVARWDPDKGWLAAIAGLHRLRDAGLRPLLVARGGSEAYEASVRAAAADAGLAWADRSLAGSGAPRLLRALTDLSGADIVSLRFALDSTCARALFRVADAVLANSHFEPFGLVGLETMAVGGVACTGMTGEDYVIPGRNALALQSDDPAEIVALLERLRAHPQEERALRRNARETAQRFSWHEIVTRLLLPRLELLQTPSAAAPAADAAAQA